MPIPNYNDIYALVVNRLRIAVATGAWPYASISEDTPLGAGGLNWSDVGGEIGSEVIPSIPNLTFPALQDFSGLTDIGDLAALVVTQLSSLTLTRLQRISGNVNPATAIQLTTPIGNGAGQFAIPAPAILNSKFVHLNLPANQSYAGINTVEDLIYFLIQSYLG